nr:hypothetical protein [uncultured Treponema sp.]
MGSTAVGRANEKNRRKMENFMKKNILFFIVTIVLLSLFSGVVITGVIRKESFCLMIWLVAGLLFACIIGYFLSELIFINKNNKIQELKFNKLNEIFSKVKFPEESEIDIETIITEIKPDGDKESMVTTKKRNLNAELCKKWIDVVADL